MKEKKINQILAATKAPLTHALFYPRVFALVAKEAKRERFKQRNPFFLLATEEYEELSRRLDRSHIQESVAVRNILRTRQLAQLLIDDKGEINSAVLPTLITDFENHLYTLGPYRQYDSARQEHILKVLKLKE